MADNYLEWRMQDYKSSKLRNNPGGIRKKNNIPKIVTDRNCEETCNFRKESLSYNLAGVEAFVMVPVKDSLSEEEMMSLIRKTAVVPVQTHSVDVATVENADEVVEADALVTFTKNLPIGIKTADCVPLVIYCPDVKGVAAVHAGWKGTLNGIVDNTLDYLIKEGASPDHMVVFFGPSIGKEVYEVGRELADRFVDAGFKDYVLEYNEGIRKPHLDLPGINKERLLRRGVLRENIIMNNGCTYTFKLPDGSFRYPSYRRSGGSPLRLLTVISLK